MGRQQRRTGSSNFIYACSRTVFVFRLGDFSQGVEFQLLMPFWSEDTWTECQIFMAANKASAVGIVNLGSILPTLKFNWNPLPKAFSLNHKDFNYPADWSKQLAIFVQKPPIWFGTKVALICIELKNTHKISESVRVYDLFLKRSTLQSLVGGRPRRPWSGATSMCLDFEVVSLVKHTCTPAGVPIAVVGFDRVQCLISAGLLRCMESCGKCRKYRSNFNFAFLYILSTRRTSCQFWGSAYLLWTYQKFSIISMKSTKPSNAYP